MDSKNCNVHNLAKASGSNDPCPYPDPATPNVSFLQQIVNESGRHFHHKSTDQELKVISFIPAARCAEEAQAIMSGHISSVGIIDVGAEACQAGLTPYDIHNIRVRIDEWRERDNKWKSATLQERERERERERDTYRTNVGDQTDDAMDRPVLRARPQSESDIVEQAIFSDEDVQFEEHDPFDIGVGSFDDP